jgi:DNA-binding response OmpR family regulator
MARILIIDDEPNICTLLAETLENEKHAVLTAHDGTSGLEKARAELPDAIILDVEMPGLNGYEVCAGLRSRPETRRIPVLMLTGRNELPDAMKGMASGADDYITKPFDVEEVLWRVQALLKTRG